MAAIGRVDNTENFEMEERLITGTGDPRRNDRHIGGAHTEIWLAAAAASIPMLLLSAILLGLTFAYRLDQNDPWFRSADSQSAALDKRAYYLNISSTRFVTVASWTSNIAPHLSTFILVLYSYRVARMFWPSTSPQAIAASQNPTPFQLSLLIRAVLGGLTPMVALGQYRRWKHKRSLPGTVTSTYWMLLVTLLLGYSVWAADTWLHVTTEAVSLARGTTNTSDYKSYSRSLNCYQYDSTTDSCSTSSRGLLQVSEAFWTMNNLSSVNRVSTVQIGNEAYAYLTSSNLARGVDYEASTYAITTQCTATPPPCQIGCGSVDSAEEVDFECDQFESSLTGSLTLRGAMNTTLLYLSSSDPTTAQVIPHTQTNPFSFATLAMMESYNTHLGNDNTCLTCAGYITWMLLCSSTVYDMTYRWTNGTFANVVSKTPSNHTLGGTFSSPFGTNVGSLTLFNAASTAAGESTGLALANTFSLVFSKTAMALGAGVTIATANLGEGETLLGTRVEKAPLFTLISLNCLYVVLSIGCAFTALQSNPKQTRDIQARLSVAGLAAQCFEGRRAELPVKKIEELFAEWSDGAEGSGSIIGGGDGGGGTVERVGIVGTEDGGWRYKKFKDE